MSNIVIGHKILLELSEMYLPLKPLCYKTGSKSEKLMNRKKKKKNKKKSKEKKIKGKKITTKKNKNKRLL